MSATPGQVYQISTGGIGQTTIAVTPTFTTNDSALLFLKLASGTTITSVSDSVNGTSGWTLRQGPGTVSAADCYIYTRDGMAAGSPVVTVTLGSSATFMGLEVTPISSTAGYDISSAFNVQSSGNTRSSNSATPSTSGLAIGCNYNDTNNNGGGIGASYTALAGTGVTGGHFWDFGSGNNFAWSEYLNYASGAQTATFDFTATNTSVTGSVIALFKDIAAGTSVAWLKA